MFYPKGFLGVSAVLFLVGMLAFVTRDLSTPPPPTAKTLSLKPLALLPDAYPETATLMAPWYQRPPLEAPKAAIVVPKGPPPPQVDTKSLAFVGQYHDQEGVASYFFKNLITGQVMVLKLNSISKGWEITNVDQKGFTLTGPGGRYEITR